MDIPDVQFYKIVLLLPGQTKNTMLLMPKIGPYKLVPDKIAAALKK